MSFTGTVPLYGIIKVHDGGVHDRDPSLITSSDFIFGKKKMISRWKSGLGLEKPFFFSDTTGV